MIKHIKYVFAASLAIAAACQACALETGNAHATGDSPKSAATASNSAGFSGFDNTEMRTGYVYIHTARNSPKIKIGGKEKILKSGMFLEAKDISIKCEANQSVFFILSNRTVVHLKENSELKIIDMKQIQPFAFDFKNEFEAARSAVEIYAVSGEFYIVTARPRPTSTMKINSDFGQFETQSRELYLKVNENGARISLIDGQSTFRALDGKTDFLQNKQSGTIVKSKSKDMYPLRIDYLTSIEEERFDFDINLCKLIFNSIKFDFDKNGKMSAERIVQKEFLMRRAKYDFRK